MKLCGAGYNLCIRLVTTTALQLSYAKASAVLDIGLLYYAATKKSTLTYTHIVKYLVHHNAK